eukprot:jgi/Mesvir1/6434/Mv19519-RA.1
MHRVVGLGASGRSAARLALFRGADQVIGVDKNTEAVALEKDSAFANLDLSRVRTELGPHDRATIMSATRLVLSPGVPPKQPDIAAALQAGIPAVSELAFAAEVIPPSIPVAAVTGTNGKSTVTVFTGQILEAAGLRTFVGGNLGLPLSEAACDILKFPRDDPPYQAIVAEVSSYQLEFPGKLHAKAGVILNLTPDHLERHGDMDTYGATKCRLFDTMGPTDVAIIPHDSQQLRRLVAQRNTKALRAWMGALPGVQLDSEGKRAIIVVPGGGPELLLDMSAMTAVGHHNAVNAGVAALLAASLSPRVTPQVLQDVLPKLTPPPHRMTLVGEDKKGVLWVDDSKATNIESTLVAVKGIPRPSVVLLGGQAKELGGNRLGFEQLAPFLGKHRAIVVFGASGDRIEQELRAAGVGCPMTRVSKMTEAVQLARTLAQRALCIALCYFVLSSFSFAWKTGDAVLLSPACASFDEFKNFAHRGDIFAELARQS